jgi:hypothetical protein
VALRKGVGGRRVEDAAVVVDWLAVGVDSCGDTGTRSGASRKTYVYEARDYEGADCFMMQDMDRM